MSVPHDQSDRSAARPVPSSRPAGWVVGVSAFAVVILVLVGVFHAVEGLAALFTNEIYLVGVRYIFALDLTTWGWIHLLLGILMVAAGIGIRTGQLWARAVGIGFAALSMLANFLFIPYYPVWSLLIIALDFVVIWALCLYSEDAARA